MWERVYDTLDHARRNETAHSIGQTLAAGAPFITPADWHWPNQLTHANVSPPPVGLWLHGPADLTELSDRRPIVITGSRSCTRDGAHIAADFAGHGQPIITTGGFGIDQAAARAALHVDGTPFTVTAASPTVAYPPALAICHDHIAHRGLVLSLTAA